MIVLSLRSSALADWVDIHGGRVLIILISMAIAREIVRRGVPPAVRRTIDIHANAADTMPGELAKRSDTLSHVLVRLAVVLILIIGIFMLLGEIGYNLAPVLTGLGIGGIAIGLGAQSLVKDTINGIFILGENQFRRGDFVTVAGVSGTVEDVNLRRTVLRDLDGTVHSVPNSSIQVSSNHTRDYSGINITVLLPQTTDLERAIAVARATGADLAADEAFRGDITEVPLPARIDAMDEKGVTLRILGKVRPGRQGQVAFELRRRLKEAFDRAGLLSSVGPPAVPPTPPGTTADQQTERPRG